MVETRKVQFTGGSTYIVSLPKSWIMEKEIEVGEALVLAPQEDGIHSHKTRKRIREEGEG